MHQDQSAPRLTGFAKPSRKGRRGFTLVELMLALTVLTLSIGAVTSTMATTRSMRRANVERDLALDAAQSVLETIRATTPADVFARFNATRLDDPATGISPGNSFPVRGLRPLPGDPDGMPGEIFFPGNGVELREDFVDGDLGMPRDLNGDAKLDPVNCAGTYRILPMRVRVRWFSAAGPQQLDLVSVISQR